MTNPKTQTRTGHRFPFFLSAFLLFTVMLTACTGKSAPTTPAPETDSTAVAKDNAQLEQPTMKAPELKADANGLIALKDCPSNDDHLLVSLSANNDEIVITYDGKPLQTLRDEDGFVSSGDEKAPVRFLDANFDGFIDIFVGPGESRTYSSLLLWDPAARQFVRIGQLGEPMLQGFMLEPSTQSVIQGGSGSWCMFLMTRSKWEGKSLNTEEELVVVSDPEQYGEYEVEAKYTLNDGEHNAMKSASEAAQLSSSWQNIIAKYGVE